MNTMQPLEFTSHPPIWIDWLLACVVWFTGGVMAYVSVTPEHPSVGHYLLMMRLLAVTWLLYAANMTSMLLSNGGLHLGWWTTIALFFIALFSLGMSIERIVIEGARSQSGWTASDDSYPRSPP